MFSDVGCRTCALQLTWLERKGLPAQTGCVYNGARAH